MSAARAAGRRTRVLASLLAVALAAGVAEAVDAPAGAVVPAQTVSDGTRTLTVSQVTGLDPNGQAVEVTGSGYDASEGSGIYVVFCAAPQPGMAPNPCGGGPGAGGGSGWVAGGQYGADNGATPFGPDGSFALPVTVSPMIGDVDCRQVRCAIVTRNDHRKIGDRSQDVVVPVSFTDADPASLPLATAAPDGAASTPATGIRIVPIAEHPKPKLPVTVKSADGRSVEVTDVSRVVSLNGSLSEIVSTLGLGNRIVGRDVSATFPEIEDVPLVTRGHDISAESVLSRRPTLVLAQTDTGPPDALKQIRDAGVPVVVFDQPDKIADIGAREMAVARTLGVTDEGDALRARTRAELRSIQAGIPDDADKPTVAFLYVRGQAGVYLIGGKGSGADSMIKAAGGIDAGTELGLKKAFTPITSEALVEAAPDVILLTTTGLESVGGIDGLVEIPGIAQTPAGRARRVLTEEDGLLFSFGSRTPVALQRLVDKLHQDTAAPDTSAQS